MYKTEVLILTGTRRLRFCGKAVGRNRLHREKAVAGGELEAAEDDRGKVVTNITINMMF